MSLTLTYLLVYELMDHKQLLCLYEVYNFIPASTIIIIIFSIPFKSKTASLSYIVIFCFC